MTDPLDHDHILGRGLDPAANPFTIGPGQIPPVMAGRDELLTEMRTYLDQLCRLQSIAPLVIESTPGLGKTALLHRVAEAAEDRGILVQNLNPRAPWESTVETALAEGDRTCRQVLLLVDDAHLDAHVAATVVDRAARVGRGRGGTGVILAGLPGSTERLVHADASLLRIQTRHLAPLEQADVDRAIGTPFASAGVAISADETLAVTVRSGGHPHWVQLWGRELWRHADATQPISMDTIASASAGVQRAMDQVLARTWRRCNHDEQTILEAVARLGNDWSLRDDVAARLGRAPFDLPAAVDQLANRGLLERSGGGFQLTWPLLGDWVARHQLPVAITHGERIQTRGVGGQRPSEWRK